IDDEAKRAFPLADDAVICAERFEQQLRTKRESGAAEDDARARARSNRRDDVGVLRDQFLGAVVGVRVQVSQADADDLGPVLVDGARARATPLELHAPVRAWFERSFEAPTRAQSLGWPPIMSGRSTLLLAPTGSGKTLAAFLAAIDRLCFEAPPDKKSRLRML